MTPDLPSVTIIIPSRPEQEEIKAVTASLNLDYPVDKLKIVVARGKQPSVQRNAALKAAQAELIYFLDDDSVPPLDNLRRGIVHFADPNVKMVGGPNLCPPEAPSIEKVFALVLSSLLAFGPSRARYYPIGKVRQSSEKELILCNLMARRDALVELGGFNEALYPNEENALMDELQKSGGKLIYDPEFYVHRRPRSNFKAFARMLMTYGRGRAEQFRVHPTLGSALNFVPPLFCVYLVSLPVLGYFLGPKAFALLGLYGVVVLLECVLLGLRGGILGGLATIPLVVVTHVLYGVGFWRGLFTTLKRPGKPGDPPRTSVALQTVTK